MNVPDFSHVVEAIPLHIAGRPAHLNNGVQIVEHK
jgi:hypothetical protein